MSLDSLDRYFEVVRIGDPDFFDKAFRLRHEVYCVEHKFEPFSEAGRETDSYDQFSAHIALIYRPTSEVVGTARLVLAGREPGLPFPMEREITDDARFKLGEFAREAVGEISRYAISKSFRRRAEEEEFADIAWIRRSDNSDRRLAPQLTLGLMRGILALTLSLDVEVLCACMRPALLKLTASFGLNFTALGPPVNYHGLRVPCFASRNDLLRGFKEHCPDYYDLVVNTKYLPTTLGVGERWTAPSSAGSG